MYISKIIKKIAVGVLLLLPFQNFPLNFMMFFYGIPKKNLPFFIKVFSYVDEMSFFIFLYIALTFLFIQPSSVRFPRSPLTYWLAAFIIYAMIIGIAKGVPVLQATFGIYDVVKNLLLIYLFCLMRFEREEFLQAIKAIIAVALVLAVVGFAGLILASAFGWGVEFLVIESSRLIQYQPISLTGTGSHNYLGIYTVLIFFLAYGIGTPFSKFSQLNLLLLIILTVSRQTYLSLVTMYLLYKRKIFLFVLVPIIFPLVVYMYGSKGETDPSTYFRLFAFLQSLKILSEHPFTGVGPGMFGDLASIIWESPVYRDWPPFMKEFAFNIGGIDQFWPVIWGDFGIIGFFLYAGGLVSLFFTLQRGASAFQRINDVQLFSIGKALQYFLAALGIMGFAAGLNVALVVYSYFALVGIYISLARKFEDVPSAKEDALA